MRVRICGSLLLAAGGLCAAPLSAAPVLPANAVVELEMVDAVASDTSKRGDFFKMRVAVPLAAQGQELVPAGTIAIGQVVHAQKAGGGGKPGELILAARYLEMPQGQVKLRSSFGAAGANRIRSSLALALAVGPFAMAVKGKNVAMPPGAPLSARIAADTAITPVTAPETLVPSTTTTETRTTAQ